MSNVSQWEAQAISWKPRPRCRNNSLQVIVTAAGLIVTALLIAHDRVALSQNSTTSTSLNLLNELYDKLYNTSACCTFIVQALDCCVLVVQLVTYSL